jgi:hypothetical protein
VETFARTYNQPSDPSTVGVISGTFESTSRFEAHAARFSAIYGEAYYQYTSFPMVPTEPLWYDSFLYMAQAISNIANRGINVTGPSLLDEMHNMTFEGVSGSFIVSFNDTLRFVCRIGLAYVNLLIIWSNSLMPIMIECRIIMYFNQLQQVSYVT